jgi:hypothetical protein
MIDPPPQNINPNERPDRLLDAAKDNLKYLIFHRNDDQTGESLVYIDIQDDLEWECDDEADNKLKTIEEELGKIQNGVASLEPIAHNWPQDLKLSTKRVLGESLARILQLDINGATEALTHAKSFVKTKSRQVSRYWTLQACLVAGGIAAVLGAIEIALRQWFETALHQMPYLLSLCFWSGCIGALLFVILKIGSERKVDSTAEKHLHYIEGISRIVAGGISGVFVGAMIKLGLVLPVFAQAGMETLAMCAGAMIAGASERFAAGIITSVENNNTNQKEN